MRNVHSARSERRKGSKRGLAGITGLRSSLRVNIVPHRRYLSCSEPSTSFARRYVHPVLYIYVSVRTRTWLDLLFVVNLNAVRFLIRGIPQSERHKLARALEKEREGERERFNKTTLAEFPPRKM